MYPCELRTTHNQNITRLKNWQMKRFNFFDQIERFERVNKTDMHSQNDRNAKNEKKKEKKNTNNPSTKYPSAWYDSN